MKKFLIILFFYPLFIQAQTTVNFYIDSIQSGIGSKFQPGVFYIPKTAIAQTDFLSNGIHQNSIRLNVIESALNNTTNLNDCIAFLDTFKTTLQLLSAKTDKLYFIFAKMPVWLSSSTDGLPAAAPGWYVLNTKPPASYVSWNNMVQSVVNTIVNTYGISNAQFEIWNEPDLGSWTGTKSEYFELFKNTYDAIKAVDTTIEVGGPATNQWAKNITTQPPYGYINYQLADSSLLAELIDSMYVWNKTLDFVSWHNFDVSHQSNKNAVEFINQKYANLGLPSPKLVLSEWNLPSGVRESALHKTFILKNQIEMSKIGIENNMIAAWQDFDQSINEFHNDYGLLTYGGIHKPFYKALQLSDKLKGNKIKVTANDPIDIISTISNDTLNILLVNYTPPPFLEAFNHTLFTGKLNTTQLDSAGFIDIIGNSSNPLDSIYKGLIAINNSTAIYQAINNSIPIYNHFDSLENNNRQFQLNVVGLTGVHLGERFLIDSSTNNLHFKYDSLRTNGFTQNGAISYITNNQSINIQKDSLNNGQINLQMQPNSIVLYQFIIPQILGIPNIENKVSILVYPNPTNERIEIKSEVKIGRIKIINVSGKILEILELNEKNQSIDFSNYMNGIYFLSFTDLNQVVKIVRE